MHKSKKLARVVIISIILSVSLLIGVNVAAAPFPDNNQILQFFVFENPFTTPQQDTFTAMQIFVENGFSEDRIEYIQVALWLDGYDDYEYLTITDTASINAVWEVLSEVEVTTRGAERAKINDKMAMYVDFQFINPNYNLGIEMFGQVYMLGRGPFVFVEGSSEQQFIDLFAEFGGIHIDAT